MSEQLQTSSDQKVYRFCVHGIGISLETPCVKCQYEVGKGRRLLHISFTSMTDRVIAARKGVEDEETSNLT